MSKGNLTAHQIACEVRRVLNRVRSLTGCSCDPVKVLHDGPNVFVTGPETECGLRQGEMAMALISALEVGFSEQAQEPDPGYDRDWVSKLVH